MITISVEYVWAAAAVIGGLFLGVLKWLVNRGVDSNDACLKDHEERITVIERDYVTKDTLRATVTEIKDTIDGLGSDLRHGVENAHARLDVIYNELLRRGN